MNRAKAILLSLRLANLLIPNRLSSTRPLLCQVTQFSDLFTYSLSNPSHASCSFSARQNLFFSSKPNSIVQLVLANDWSDELKDELEKSNPGLTHETAVYVLRKLDNEAQKALNFFNWVCEKKVLKLSSSMYSIMLRILAQQGSMKEFWVTLNKMKEQGFYIDEETYMTILGIFKKAKMDADVVALTHFYNRMVQENAMDSVAKKVAELVLRAEWSSEVEKELEEMKLSLSHNFVIRVLKELRNNPLKALKLFVWVGQLSDYEHDAITYNALLRVLCRHDSIKEFWSTIEQMKRIDLDLDFDTYIKISRQFQKFKMMEDAVKLYEFMMDGPFMPSVQDCSLLLRSLSATDNPDLHLVFRVVKKYESTGHFLSKAVYDGIHRSLTSVGRFDEAQEIVNDMKNAGYEPDNITYSQLIFGLCKAKRLEEASKVLDEMEAQNCIPDIKTWTILIQGHCAANEVDMALMCFAKMMEKNCDPDTDLLDVLINGFLRQKRIDGAYKLLVEMVDKARLVPWQATYKNLIEKLLGLRKLDEAMDLLAMMKKQNHPAFPEPFVKYISKFGTVEDAAQFLKALSIKEYPSSLAYLRVFQSFFDEGRHIEAKDLLYKCPHHIRTHPKISELFGSPKSINSAV